MPRCVDAPGMLGMAAGREIRAVRLVGAVRTVGLRPDGHGPVATRMVSVPGGRACAAHPRDPIDLESAMPLLADRYETGSPLGAGGMGRVVAAHDHRLDRPVAVKLIRDELLADDSARQRLLREARAAAQLHHPHTVAVYDAGDQDGRPYVVMELVQGASLADRLLNQGPLSATEGTGVAAAVLDALAAAHDHGLVHRDVKPSNVLLPEDGGVKLADFGIAVDLSANATLTDLGHVLGSPRYLAPERATGQAAAPSSDLYSTGVMLFEMLAGHPPFQGDNAVATLLAHQQQPVPPLSSVAAGVPGELAAVTERALAKDPQQRFTSARSMRDALLGAAAEASCSPDLPTAASASAVTGPIELSATSTAASHGATTATGLLNAAPAATSATDQPAGDHQDPPAAAAAAQPAGDHEEPVAMSRARWMVPLAAGAALLVLSVAMTQPGDGRHHELSAVEPESMTTHALDSVATEALVPVIEQSDPAAADDDEDASADGGEESPNADDLQESYDDSQATDGEADGQDDHADGEVGEVDHPAPPFEPAVAAGLLDDLIAELAHDPQSAGTAADDLLDDLRELRRENDPEARRETARGVLVEMSEHHRDRALDSDVAGRVAAVLEALGRPEQPQLHDVSWLFAQTAADRTVSGDRVGHLLSDLDHLLDRGDLDKVGRDAERLIDHLDRWADQGRLDAALARRVQDALAPLT